MHPPMTSAAFGVRWAARLMPAQLMELMRHESIETTLRFYVGTDAQRTAEAAWAAFERVGRQELEASGNSLANRLWINSLLHVRDDVPDAQRP